MRVALVDFDPQKSLTDWLARRRTTVSDGTGGNAKGELCIFEGAPTAGDAVERADMAGYECCVLDGPPAFLAVTKDMIEAADLAIIPLKPSFIDLEATQDVIVLAREAEKPHLCVFNDVGVHEKVTGKAHEFLVNARVPVATTHIVHRTAYILGMTVGKSAAEVNKGKDTQASREIDALWAEVKSAVTKASRTRARARVKEAQSDE
jgi:chromosome partitioning protein